MKGKRAYKVAAELGVDPKALTSLLQSLGVEGVKNHMSIVDDAAITRVTRHLADNPPQWLKAPLAGPPPANVPSPWPPPRTPAPTPVPVAPSPAANIFAPLAPLREPAVRLPDWTNSPREGESFGTEFLDNVAHQMIAPLQSIELHCTGMLKGQVPEGKRNQRLKEVIGHARVLADMAQRLRFLHELVSGAQVGTGGWAEWLSFAQVTTLWIDGFNNYLPQRQSTGIDVDIDHPNMNLLPKVVASEVAVRQVVMNLYDNAFKYGSNADKIKIRARIDHPFITNEFSHYAKVPLTEEAASRMFERGYRSPEVRALRASGTGVGMWISRELMHAMQGDMRAVPTNQSITRFVLKWRLA